MMKRARAEEGEKRKERRRRAEEGEKGEERRRGEVEEGEEYMPVCEIIVNTHVDPTINAC